jgi:zinc/manganese transport system substrate-binding protein
MMHYIRRAWSHCTAHIPVHTVALVAALSCALIVVVARPAAAQLKVVTSTTDLAAIAKAVGGAHVTVTHIGEGYQDPHFVEAKPSFVLQLRKADVWAFVGLDLEIGWMPLLIDGARNPRIRQGGTGYLDVSTVIPVLDRPVGNIDRSQGDVHPLGNPHYWLDPNNGKRIARLFAQKFAQLDPAHAAVFQANERALGTAIDAAMAKLAPQLAKLRGAPIIAWHTSWRYLAEFTKMNIVGFMEPKPGIPPSPAHLAGVVQTIKRTGAKIILMEPFYDRKLSDFVASHSGARVLMLPASVGGVRGVDDYVGLLTYDITQLAGAL